MSLETIVGPPNSGRAGEVLRRLRAGLGARPFLVVPTGDDIARFERELGASGEPLVGATIRTFASLVGEVAAATALRHPPPLSDAQRLALVRAAVAGTPLRLLRRSAAAPGFAGALEALIAELQAALVSPADLRAAAQAAEGGDLELEIASLYERYERLRDEAGRSDEGAIARAAIAALAADPGAWGGRPVLVYGFDDLTEAQLRLLEALAAAAPVTVAVAYADRRALAARARLLARLEQDLGATRAAELEFEPGYTPRASLRHLSRALFEPQAERLAGDGGVRLLDSGGERGEAEAVGLEIARLVAAGADPGAIVVVLRQPAASGALFASVLRGLGVPVALEASLPLARTAVGGALLALCRAASPEGEPADLVAHLRADPAIPPGAVDWLERAVLRREATSVAEVRELFSRWRHPPATAERLLAATSDSERLAALAAGARRLAEAPHRERAPLARERSRGVPFDPLEARAAIAAAELCEELAAVGRLPGCTPPGLDEAAGAIEAATVRAWVGPAESRVRIVSPYRVRAAAATHLFCCGLQEGVFPGPGGGDPLLGEGARARLGIPALRRSEQADEERYLFHLCASRPVERLYLSWHSSDEDGHPAPRSPFVDEVLDLVGDGSDQAEKDLTTKRGLARPVPRPAEASTPRTLARALALAGGLDGERHRATLARLGVDQETAAEVAALIGGVADPAAKPGPLAQPAVLAALGRREHVSAGSLEGWVECSYRWFVSHELAPQRLEPEADPLWLGSIAHEALRALYHDPPGAGAVPRAADAGRWKARLGELLDEAAAGAGPLTAARRLELERLRIQLEAFLDDEARSGSPLRPRPDLLERGFGFADDEQSAEALDLGAVALRGRIDRIDVEPGGSRALVRDYKTSSKVPGAAKLGDEGKLQLQLYMVVARERLGLDPVGGLYQPLGAYGDRRPRGIVRRSECGAGGVLDGLDLSLRGDAVDDDEFDRALDDALTLARREAARMLAGDIRRDPHGGACPRYCTFQPICRLERAVGLEDEGEAER